MKKNIEKIGAIIAIAGVMVLIASALYMFIKLHWIVAVTITGFFMMCIGLMIMSDNDTEDEEEDEE